MKIFTPRSIFRTMGTYNNLMVSIPYCSLKEKLQKEAELIFCFGEEEEDCSHDFLSHLDLQESDKQIKVIKSKNLQISCHEKILVIDKESGKWITRMFQVFYPTDNRINQILGIFYQGI